MKTYFYLCVKRLFTAIGLLTLMLLTGQSQASLPALAQGPETTVFVNQSVPTVYPVVAPSSNDGLVIRFVVASGWMIDQNDSALSRA